MRAAGQARGGRQRRWEEKFRKKNKRQESAWLSGEPGAPRLASFSLEGVAHRKLQRRKLFKRTEERTPHPSVPGRERLPPAPAARGQGEAPCAPSCTPPLPAATPQPRGPRSACSVSLLSARPPGSPQPHLLHYPTLTLLILSHDPFHHYLLRSNWIILTDSVVPSSLFLGASPSHLPRPLPF